MGCSKCQAIELCLGLRFNNKSMEVVRVEREGGWKLVSQAGVSRLWISGTTGTLPRKWSFSSSRKIKKNRVAEEMAILISLWIWYWYIYRVKTHFPTSR